MNHLWYSDPYNSISIDRVHYKRKNLRFHGILIIPFQINLFFFSYEKSYFFRVKM